MNRFAIAIFAALIFSPLSSAAEMQTDIVYAKRGDRELKLDFISPGGTMRPLLICIHGGGWRGGNKRDFHDVMNGIVSKGIAAATVQYRLSDEAIWPAQIDDVRAAHKYLVDNAEKYGIDPERIAVTGGSAGGHLALMLGLGAKEESESLRVRGIVNLFGPAELRDIEKIEHVRSLVESLVGGKLEEKSDALSDASPVTIADRTDPPVLTFHGTDDKIVPYEQATILHAALKKSQIPNRLFTMEDTGHGLGSYGGQVIEQLGDFVDIHLNGSSEMPLIAHEDFDEGAERWRPTEEAAWVPKKKDGRTFFSLIKKKSDYQPKVRSPHNIALLSDIDVGDFVLDVDLRSTNEPYGHQSLCLFFGHQDPSHFYYVHFGRKADAHANSIFLVNDEPRVSIAKERTDGTDWSRGWHRARIKRDTQAGTIEVFFDDMENPVMRAEDKTFTHGKIGVGSFDDKGDFDSIRLWGKPTKE